MQITDSARKHALDDATPDAATRDAEAFIASIDPATMRDGQHLRAISAARQAVEEAENHLAETVAAARAAGDSWTRIGLALRTSKQAAHRKFSHHD